MNKIVEKKWSVCPIANAEMEAQLFGFSEMVGKICLCYFSCFHFNLFCASSFFNIFFSLEFLKFHERFNEKEIFNKMGILGGLIIPMTSFNH